MSRSPIVAPVLSLFLLAGSRGVPSPQATDGPSTAAPDLGVILAKTAEYCRKLESVAFDYICREEITERIDPNLDASRPLGDDRHLQGLQVLHGRGGNQMNKRRHARGNLMTPISA
jgi:hypothetical protein